MSTDMACFVVHCAHPASGRMRSGARLVGLAIASLLVSVGAASGSIQTTPAADDGVNCTSDQTDVARSSRGQILDDLLARPSFQGAASASMNMRDQVLSEEPLDLLPGVPSTTLGDFGAGRVDDSPDAALPFSLASLAVLVGGTPKAEENNPSASLSGFLSEVPSALGYGTESASFDGAFMDIVPSPGGTSLLAMGGMLFTFYRRRA